MPASLPPLVPRWVSLKRTFRFAANPIPIMYDNLKKYGRTYTFHIGGVKKGVATIEPTVIQHILQKNNRNYRKSNIQTGVLKKYVGGGLLTSEGKYWLQQRRLIQPGFHRDRLSALVKLMNQEIEQHFDDIDVSDPVDISTSMHTLAFNIVAKALFSTSISGEEMESLSRNLNLLQEFIIKQVRQPYLLPWFKVSGLMRKHQKLAQITRKSILDVIRQRVESGIAQNDLLQMLLDSRYEDTGEGMTEEQLLDESLILFVAGHETSANALGWIFYLLSRHSESQDKINREIDLVLGGRQAAFSDLMKLTYTRQVIEEALRMYPPAWVVDRVAIEQDEINGIIIPKDALMIIYIYGVHHDENLWDAPNEFKPERFGAEQKAARKPYAYFPFGGGPRLCIGNNFAMMEMQLVLVHFLQRFQISKPSATTKVQPMVTLRPDRKIVLDLIRK